MVAQRGIIMPAATCANMRAHPGAPALCERVETSSLHTDATQIQPVRTLSRFSSVSRGWCRDDICRRVMVFSACLLRGGAGEYVDGSGAGSSWGC
jgi:hypothetical protein